MYAALDELSHFLAVRLSAANGEHSNSLVAGQASRSNKDRGFSATRKASSEKFEPLVLCGCIVRLMQLDLYRSRFVIGITYARSDEVKPSFGHFVSALIVPSIVRIRSPKKCHDPSLERGTLHDYSEEHALAHPCQHSPRLPRLS